MGNETTARAIQFENVSKTFPGSDKPAVCETSLSIAEGEFVTIVGTSGSGKTTLLKMVNRLYDCTSGRITVQGKNHTDIPLTELRSKIGYVIQQIGLFPHMSVADNIATVPKILKWGRQKIEKRVHYLLDLVQLPPEQYKDRYPRQLSGGEQQRVGIARAMASDPAILLMDEPFGALDAITRTSLQDELAAIQKKLNKTILFVTHDIHEALKLGDKVIIMNEGKVQQFAEPLNILMQPANAFVRELVQTEDMLQLLSFIRAERVMRPAANGAVPEAVSVRATDHLQHVLSVMLKHHVEAVRVKDEAGRSIGRITFAELYLKEQDKRALLAAER